MADEIIVDFAACFRYEDPATGDIITKGPVSDYVKRIAVQVCGLIGTINTQKDINTSFNNRIGALENKNNSAAAYTLPNLYPVCIGPQTTLLPLDQFVALLENKFCQLSNALGSTTAIFNAITTPPSDFNHAKALGTSGGTLGQLQGWVQNPLDLTNSFTDMWLTILDLRSAVRNIQINCCSTSCAGVALVLTATLQNKILKLFFTGAIPSNLGSCSGGSTFKISDDSGNSLNQVVDIIGNLNNISGVSIDLTSSPINFADDLHIHAIACFSDPNIGTVCQSCLEVDVDNNSNCPVLNITAGLTSLTYNFVNVSGTLTYSTQLFDMNNVMVQSQNESVSGPITVSGMFTGLNPGALYRMRIQMITAANTKTCPLTPISTLPNPCSPPNGLSVTLVYL